MKDCKRITIATLSGLVCGFICYGLASSGDYQLMMPITLQIISSRTLIGFAIGISSLAVLPWFVHGILMGFLFSLPLSFSGLVADIPGFSKTTMFLSTVFMGIIYGFLIELVTTVFFKAKIKKIIAKSKSG